MLRPTPARCRFLALEFPLYLYVYVSPGVPECSGKADLMEGDAETYTCKVPFSGSEFPTVGWYLDDEELTSADNSNVGLAEKSYSIDPATGMYDGKTLACKMQFGEISDQCKIEITVKCKCMQRY